MSIHFIFFELPVIGTGYLIYHDLFVPVTAAYFAQDFCLLLFSNDIQELSNNKFDKVGVILYGFVAEKRSPLFFFQLFLQLDIFLENGGQVIMKIIVLFL